MGLGAKPAATPPSTTNDIAIVDFMNISHILYKASQLNKNGLESYLHSVNSYMRVKEFVVVCDDKRKNYYRKKILAEYKDNRKKKPLDKEFLAELDKAKKEIQPLIYTGMEADDFISVLSRNYTTGNIIVMSSDSDFKQLGMFQRVKQFNPLKKKITQHSLTDAMTSLVTKILKGDAKDNVKKCHNHRQIKTTDLEEVVHNIILKIKQYVRSYQVKKIVDLPIGNIIWSALIKKFDIDLEKYKQNFLVLNLLHPTYQDYTEFTEKQIMTDLASNLQNRI